MYIQVRIGQPHLLHSITSITVIFITNLKNIFGLKVVKDHIHCGILKLLRGFFKKKTNHAYVYNNNQTPNEFIGIELGRQITTWTRLSGQLPAHQKAFDIFTRLGPTFQISHPTPTHVLIFSSSNGSVFK